MMATPDAHPPSGDPLGLMLAADLQDNLLIASNDLDRLQSLLANACTTLADSFIGANAHIEDLRAEAPAHAVQRVTQHLGQAVTALQFQDMAAQLIAHTHLRLRHCADRLAADTVMAFDGDDDDSGTVVVAAQPLRPNPVTQDEMDAGSIDLF
jgi:hypothetical protein